MAKNYLAYEFKITLRGSKPPIWRRFVVPGHFFMDELHDVIQTVMGWDCEHLHVFRFGKREIGPAEEAGLDGMEDETDVLISDCLKKGMKFEYIYDFGDNWVHDCVVEATRKIDKNADVAFCVAGERACPPEDCGGLYGYYRKIEILKNPESPDFMETLEWMGEDFDPNFFDLDEVNAALEDLIDEEEDEDSERPPWAEEMCANFAIAAAGRMGIPPEAAAKRIVGQPDSPEMAKLAEEVGKSPAMESLCLGLMAILSTDVDAALSLAGRALALDPANTDAQLVELLNLDADSPVYLKRSREIAQAAREKCLVDMVANVDDTLIDHYRYYPFFRAEQHLIHTLAVAGELEEAIRRCDFFLALKPPDRMTVSSILVALLIRLGQFERARKALEDAEEFDSTLAWLDALIEFGRGDLSSARRALVKARALDHDVETMLVSGVDENDLDDDLSVESFVCWTTIRTAWAEVPGARAWLRKQSNN